MKRYICYYSNEECGFADEDGECTYYDGCFWGELLMEEVLKEKAEREVR